MFSVWDAHRYNPFGRIAHEIAGRFFPADRPQFISVPFSCHQVDPIKESLKFPPESGWIATISKPRFEPSIKLKSWGGKNLERAMSGHSFAIFVTAIARCGIVRGARGICAVQLPMASEDKTRSRIRQRDG